MDELPYPFDKYPDHYSQWQDCVEEYLKVLVEVERLRSAVQERSLGVVSQEGWDRAQAIISQTPKE